MEEISKSLILKLQDVFLSEQGHKINVAKEGAKNFPAAPGDLAISQEDKRIFRLLLSYVEETILKPWSDSQADFLVLTRFEDDDLNQVNYMSVLSSFGFAQDDKTSLEIVKSSIKNHDQYYPNAVLLMNNLGVMFSENALYEESEDCFNTAKMCLQHQQDHLKRAVIMLNQALLKRVLGKDEEAADLAARTAASLCYDISLRTTNDAHLTVKLKGRVANMLQEFGNLKMLDKILRNVVCSDTPADGEFATAVLSWQLMKIQLEGMGQKIPVKEVRDFISHLLVLLDELDASKISMNAEFMRIVISAAKICLRTGQSKQACELLNKLQSIFLLVHGENNFLYGSLLYQIGCFLHGCGRFGDAETALKQAEDILICYCGENHHSVALCRSVLGSCILLKGNAKDALEVLNEALTMFKKLNPIHPGVGEILLKFAFLYVEERNFQQAQETVQEAEAIFVSSCGKVSCKTASAFFQVGMIFQRFEQFRMSAVEKIQEGIDMMINLGMNLNHPDVMFWSSFLGVLKHSLGMVKEAEKCFTDIQNCFPFCHDRGSNETEIITPGDFLHPQDRAGDGSDRSSSVKAQVISLVNLVHMKRGNKRIQYLDKLMCCLKEEEIEEIRVRDFAGQDLYLFSHRVPLFNRPAVLIILDSLPDRSEADNGTDCKMFLASSAEKASLTLFARIQDGGLNMKEINRLTSSFRESVNMLFLHPKFGKGVVEGKDLYVELPAAVDISSFSSHLDCLPLLVEVEWTKSQEQCDEFDYLTSWQSSVDSAMYSVPHVSYFSFRCVNQREAEFVFDHFSQNLGQKLALNGFQEHIISDVSLEENVARFIFQDSRNLFLTIVVRNLSVIVKCCSVQESDANCFCCSVRNALNTAIESLSVTPVKSSGWLACEDVASVLDPDEESLSDSCSLSVSRDPVGCGLTFETGKSTRPCTWLSWKSTEEDLKRKKAAGKSQNKNVEIIHPIHRRYDKSRASIDVGLCLLECLLNRSGPVSFEEEELNGGELSSTDEQSTENSVFAETSVVEQVLCEEEKLERFGDTSSEHRARDRRKKEERDTEEAGGWPQQGGTTCSQQLHGNYINQGALSSSSTQSNKTVEDIPLLQQDACVDAKVTGNRPLGARDWEHEGAKPKQVRKQARSEVVQLPSDPPVPQSGAFLVESSNDSSLSQGGRVERTSTEREQHGQFERKINWQECLQTAKKRDERDDREMQDAGRRSQEENAAASEQSTESSVFSEASLVELLPREEELREQVVGRSSGQRAREGIKKEEREMREAGSWPQQGGTTYSQQLHGNYDNQSSSSSSSTQSNKILEDTALLQQGAFLEEKVTGDRSLGARDWESEGAKPKQVSKKGRSEVVKIASEPPDPRFGASSVDSSNDSSLSQEKYVERTSIEREQRGQFERKINCQKWMIRREQGAGKREKKKERKMQESKRTSQEGNADADSEQSTESAVFAGTSLAEPLLRKDEKRDRFVARNSERRAKETTRKEERVACEAGSWPQQGGTTCSQQLSENCDNQGALSSSSTQSNKIVEDTALLQQDAFLDEKVTGDRSLGRRDWESEGAKPKQVSRKGRSEVVQTASEPPDPRFGASSVDSSNDISLSQGRRVERTSTEREQRGQFERKINCQEWLIREQRAEKRGVRKEKKMQDAQNRSQDENAACSQQLRGQYHDQCSLNTSKTQGGIAENIPLSQQDALADTGRPSAATDRERNGLTDEFLARHTQDMSLRGSLNKSIGADVSFPPDISAQGTSYTDGYFRDSQNRSQSDPVQSAGHRAPNPTLILGNLNSAVDNENATSDPREYMLNQPMSVSSTDFALGTGTRRQRAIHFSSSNAVISAAEVSAQEEVPLDEPCHGGESITRGAPLRNYVPESLDITGSSLTWVPHQRDTSQQHPRREPTVNCEWCGSCLYEQREGTSHQCQAAECHLCLGLIDPSIRCRVFPCGHKFHITCANDWILRGHDTCPICGHPLIYQPSR